MGTPVLHSDVREASMQCNAREASVCRVAREAIILACAV